MAKKVVLAGPFSFTAILRMVKQAYENFRIQENIYKIVTMLTKGRKIEELSKPFAAVATDLATGREHVFRNGNSAAAVCASVAIPGIFVDYVEPMLHESADQMGFLT